MTSLLTDRTEGRRLDLVTSWARTPGGLEFRPSFFEGTLTRPDVAAAALLTVADVATTTYADLSTTSAAFARQDPVVTAGGDRLRFESFSGCNGVHARFDLLPDGLVGRVGAGTTNVDVNPPLRIALAGIGRGEPLHLAVGADGLRVTTAEEEHEEPKVDLPDRWVRGLAEVPLLLRESTPVATLRGGEVGRFLGGLPRAAPGPTLHLSPSPRGLRPSLHTGPGSVRLAGAGRLAAASRIAHHASRLDVWAGPTGCSAWSFELPGGRLLLFLTPSPWRGFSGEGSLLRLLAADGADAHGRRVLEHLAWEPVVDPVGVSLATGLEADEVEAGLAWLAASGRVGYDLTERAWFHRDLPLDTEEVLLRRHPRLAGARRLLDAGAVTALPGDPPRWQVGSERRHLVVQDHDDRLTCDCPWMSEHGHTRGPCKHALAAQLARDGGS